MVNSFVGMGFVFCPICCARHGETVLIHMRMQKIQEEQITSFGLCPECEGKIPEYVAIVILDHQPKPEALPHTWARTNEVIWMKREAWRKVINLPIPETMAFGDRELSETLKKLTKA